MFDSLIKPLSAMVSKDAWYQRIVTPQIDELIARMPKPLGSFGYDAWGYNEDAARLGLGLIKWFYDHYFHVRVSGLEHIPVTGRVMVIANHSGQLPIDGLLIACALATNPQGPRAPRAMVERFIPTVPWLGLLLSSIGAVIGDPHNCIRMLEQDEAVIVFPEGVRGSGKLYRHRYELQRFGSGFMHLAMQTQTPIVPCAVVGCEETMPSLANLSPLARLLGIPYVPVTTPLPLPARVSLHFGEPMRFSPQAGSEEDVVARVETVKSAIAALLRRGLSERRHIFGNPAHD